MCLMQYLVMQYQSSQMFYTMSRELTVGPLNCVLEGRQMALVLEGRQSTVHCRKKLPIAGSIMGWQYENPSYCCRQMPSQQLATDEVNPSKVQCQGITPSYQSASQAWQH